MLTFEKYNCPKCGKEFVNTRCGFSNNLVEPRCPKCGYKLSTIEQVKYACLPKLFNLIDILIK